MVPMMYPWSKQLMLVSESKVKKVNKLQEHLILQSASSDSSKDCWSFTAENLIEGIVCLYCTCSIRTLSTSLQDIFGLALSPDSLVRLLMIAICINGITYLWHLCLLFGTQCTTMHIQNKMKFFLTKLQVYQMIWSLYLKTVLSRKMMIVTKNYWKRRRISGN